MVIQFLCISNQWVWKKDEVTFTLTVGGVLDKYIHLSHKMFDETGIKNERRII